MDSNTQLSARLVEWILSAVNYVHSRRFQNILNQVVFKLEALKFSGFLPK